MVQIGRRKKKGRPPKADLDRRIELSYNPPVVVSRRESEVPRRSTRTRNLTYNEDSFYDDLYDDYEDEDQVDTNDDDEDEESDEDEDEDERRREKKVKLVVKIPDNKKRVDSVSRNNGGGGRGSGGGGRGGRRRSSVSQQVSAPESSSEYGEDDKPFKKRKIEGEDEYSVHNHEEFEDQYNEDDDDNEEDDTTVSVSVSDRSKDQKKNVKANGVVKRLDSIIQPQGKLFESSRGVPLPERRQLEFILDRLQKKDVYSVYAEPVDPEELPDYHDVIEHPMDFGTIRKKLANGAYSKLEQFEHDVSLISTNAMQYNAPETVYFRQARSIQELARKKFERLRIELQTAAAEPKPEEPIKTNSVVKKPLKRPSCKPIQEPLGSDFSSGATLATTPNISTLSNKTQATAYEKPSTFDGHFDGNSSVTESKPEKTEEQIPGKGVPSKLGRKPVLLEENRRTTYNNSSQPIVRIESMSTIFESEKVELTSVGLHVDNSYARSLARFAATLGPVAWKVASARIEQALPGGVKFGRGWVGEYEPLPTPVLMIEKQPCKLPQLSLPAKPANSIFPVKSASSSLSAKSANSNLPAKSMNVRESEPRPTSVQMNRNQTQWQPGKCSSRPESRNNTVPDVASVPKKDTQLGFRTAVTSGSLERDFASPSSERNQTQRQPGKCSSSIPESRSDKNETQPGSRAANSSGSMERHFINPNSEVKMGFVGVSGSKPMMNTMRPELHRSFSDTGNPKENTPQKQTSRLMEVVSTNKNLVQTDGRLPNGKANVSSSNYQGNGLPFPNQQPVPRAAVYFPQVNHDQGLSDPVQMMRMLAEKTQNNSKSLNFAAMDAARSTPSDPSTRRDDSSGASSAAARAWMTLGAGHFKAPENNSVSPRMQIAASSLYNSSRENHPHSEVPVSRDSLRGKPNNFPPQMFLPQSSSRTGEDTRFQNSRQQMGLGFPQQLVTTDLSRFQMQTPWQGLQPMKKQDTLPPDLNISFQSSGSPRQSNQPDLALQL